MPWYDSTLSKIQLIETKAETDMTQPKYISDTNCANCKED